MAREEGAWEAKRGGLGFLRDMLREGGDQGCEANGREGCGAGDLVRGAQGSVGGIGACGAGGISK